jgi:hypothetical protein
MKYPIKITEWAECRIWEKGILKETRIFKGQTVTLDGKRELAELVGGIDSKTIDTVWAKVNGSILSKTSSNSRSNNTLSVATSTPFSTIGTYTAVFTGNAALGFGSYYNSIGVTITLGVDSELDITVRWAFSGAAAGMYGDEICASRLGGIGDGYDYPISSVGIYYAGVEKDRKASTNSVFNNTLTVTHISPFTGPTSLDAVEYLTNAPTFRFFDKFNGFTIDIASGQDFYFEAEFVFG